MKTVVSILVVLIGVLPSDVNAQCAMCRATLENNVSQGNIGIAAGINFGILYLLVIPYIAVGTLAWFWYRSSKKVGKAGPF